MAELIKAPWSDWETVRMIGRGSFGTVYEIQRKLVDEDTESAALKVITIPQNPSDVEELYSEGYDDESITATFNSHLKSIVAEYSLMRKMDGSANIVNCKDIRYIQHDDGIGWDIFIRMELLTPLMKALPADTAEQTIIKIGKDICSALVLCKKHEIIHRDIKPQNIFVSPNGDYKLGDFGIAKTVEKTMGGTKIGTYKYMAPEVYNNQPYGSAADIYSLGLVLYWLLNERRMPFMPLPPAKLGAGMDEEARHRRLSGERLPAPAHGSDELKQIVLKACAYDPKDRYTSAAAMLDDLSKMTGGVEPIASAIISEEESEEAKTTGPIFGGAKKVKAEVIEVEDSDATVGPTFVAKPSVVEEKQAELSNALDSSANNEAQKKNGLKYILVVLGIVLAIILFLLLRSCGEIGQVSDPSDGTTGLQTTEGTSITESTTEQTTDSTEGNQDIQETIGQDTTGNNKVQINLEDAIPHRDVTIEKGSSFLLSDIEDSSIEWSSSDSLIASVDRGKVTALGGGTATITARYQGQSVDCIVRVRGSMSYAQYVSATMGSEVTIECYVQATQSWWDNTINVYAADKDGAYFLYNLNCSREASLKLVPGTLIRVKGIKSEWGGEVEIIDGSFECVEGADKYIAKPIDLSNKIDSSDLINYQNQLVLFKNMTVNNVAYKNGVKGDDIFLFLTKNGENYEFYIEVYLTDENSSVYKCVESLETGDIIDVTSFLYWYEGMLPHVVEITVVQ